MKSYRFLWILMVALPILSMFLYAGFGYTWWEPLPVHDASGFPRFMLLFGFHIGLPVVGFNLLMDR